MKYKDNKEFLESVNFKLDEVLKLEKQFECNMYCMEGSCPFRVNLSNRCLIEVLKETIDKNNVFIERINKKY